MSGTPDLKYLFGLLSTDDSDAAAIGLFEALIAEIGRLENRIAVLERVRAYNERELK